ncbi:MAG: lysylphosphatidylglycerol synthase transmembrane domain-containing protein [Gemmatimonadota bacterium]
MRRRTRTAVGIVLSLVLLGWALNDVSASEVLAEIRMADPVLLTVAILITLIGFWIRAVRWGILLIPVSGAVPLKPRLAGTFIGFAVNNLLPARIGEFARAFSLSRLSTVSTSAAFATLVVERLLDGLVLVGLLFAAMATASFPAAANLGGVDLRSAALAVTAVMVAVAVGLFLAVTAPVRADRVVRFATGFLPERPRIATIESLRGFARGLRILRSPRLFVISAVFALGQWIFLATSYWLGYLAFGIDSVPFTGAVFLQSLISLAVAVPSSPGFFGPFEAAARFGLGLWGVPAERAVSFAIGYHIAGFLPVTLIGLYFIWRMNLRWSDVRHSQENLEAEAADPQSSLETR